MSIPVAAGDQFVFDNTGGVGIFDVSALNGVLKNDAGGSLTADDVFTTGYGKLTLNGDGSFHYQTYDPHFSGFDTFVYHAINPDGTSADTLVNIQVNGPPLTQPDFYETNEQGFASIIKEFGVLVNDSMVGHTTVETRPGTEPVYIPGPRGLPGVFEVQPIYETSYGSLTLYDTGSFFYIPYDPNFTGTDTFVYRAVNEFGESKDTLVTINVPTATAGPATVADTYNFAPTKDAGGNYNSLHVDAAHGVLANDSPTATALGLDFTTAYGFLSFNGDGSFTYTPYKGAGFEGQTTDQFVYTAYDDQFHESKQTLVTIHLDGALVV